MQKEEADMAVAMAFYANGMPFRIVRNRYFRTMLRRVAACRNYKPPSYNALRTTLLAKASASQAVPLRLSLRELYLSSCALSSCASQP